MIEDGQIASIRDVAIKRLHTGRVTKVANTTLPNSAGAGTKITDWTIDDDGWCDSQTVWLPVGGILVMQATMRFQANSSGFRFISLLRNGSRVAGYLTQPTTIDTTLTVAYIANVDAGDYFEVVIQQVTSPAVDILARADAGDSQWSWQLYEV